MAWTPWMRFGIPRSFEKPWRMMRPKKHIGEYPLKSSTISCNWINENIIQGVEDWHETQMKVAHRCDFWCHLSLFSWRISVYRGMQWVLKATFFSDSAVDRTIGFAGPDGGDLELFIVQKMFFLCWNDRASVAKQVWTNHKRWYLDGWCLDPHV